MGMGVEYGEWEGNLIGGNEMGYEGNGIGGRMGREDGNQDGMRIGQCAAAMGMWGWEWEM